MKYKLVEKKFFSDIEKELWQIECVEAFANINVGERGGFIEKESNLSQVGNAWVYSGARVFGNAWVSGDARVFDNAWVYDNAKVSGNAQILVLGKLGQNGRFVTATLDKSKKIQISCGWFLGGIAAFEKAVKSKYGDGDSDYMLIIPLLKKKEAEWQKGASNER